MKHKMIPLILLLISFVVKGQNENFEYIERLTPTIQKNIFPDLKEMDGFSSYSKSIELKDYDPYKDLEKTSGEINDARYNKLINDYKIKGIDFIIDVSQDYVDVFLKRTPLGPIYNKSIDFIQNEFIAGENSENQTALEASIEQSYSGYIKSFLESNPNATAGEIAEHQQRFVSLDLVKKDNYPIIGKEIDEFLLEYTQRNEERLTLITQDVQKQLLEGKAEIRDLNGKMADLETGQQQLKAQFISLEERAEQKYASFLKFQQATNEKFETVFSSLDEMNKEIETNSMLIRQNSEEIETIRKKVNKNENDIQTLKQLQDKNEKLINENAFKIDVVSDVLYNNVTVSDKIKLLETGVAQVENKNEEIERLKSIQKLEDFNRKLSVASESITLAKSLGLSDGDAKNASDVIQLAGIFAQGASAYYTGNVLGGLQAVNSLMAFGKEPEPDPEFQAIMQQFEIINQRLNIIDQKLDVINQKLTRLFEVEIELHKEVMSELNDLQKQLSDQDEKN